MVTAASLGVTPRQFYRMTLGEIFVMVEGAQEKQRAEAITLTTSILRALSASFGSNTDPLRGLVEGGGRQAISPAEVKAMRFWRPVDAD